MEPGDMLKERDTGCSGCCCGRTGDEDQRVDRGIPVEHNDDSVLPRSVLEAVDSEARDRE